jgi:DNA processing protein
MARELGADLARRLDAPEPLPAPADRGASARRDDPDYARLLDALGHDPQAMDALTARTGLTVAALSSMLLMLELEGIVVTQPGGYYALCP